MPERIEIVRDAMARAATGLSPPEYREFLELVLSDADGWRMELEEMGDNDDAS